MKNDSVSFKLAALVIIAGVIVALVSPAPATASTPAAVTVITAAPVAAATPSE